MVFRGVDDFGNVYVVIANFEAYDVINSTYPYVVTLPSFPGEIDRVNYVVSKFGSDLDLQWARLIGVHSSWGFGIDFNAFSVTSDGGLLVSRSYMGLTDFSEVISLDHEYGSGQVSNFFVKFDGFGQIEFLSSWESEFANDIFTNFFEGGSFFFVPNYLPPSGVDLVNSIDEDLSSTFAMLNSASGVEWVWYFPSWVFILESALAGDVLSLLLSYSGDNFWGVSSSFGNYLLRLNITDGRLLSVDPIEFSWGIGPVLSTEGDSLVLSYTYGSSLYRRDITSGFVTNVPFPISVPDHVFLYEYGNLVGVGIWDRNVNSLPFSDGMTSSIWGSIEGSSYDYFLFMYEGAEFVEGLWIKSSVEIIVSMSYAGGRFMASSMLNFQPFPLEGSFRDEPLGYDAFIFLADDGGVRGTFYGTIGRPVRVC